MTLIEIERSASILKKPMTDVSHLIGGDLLDNIVTLFVGDVNKGNIESRKPPSERLKDCLELTNFEGSTADFLVRAVHALWVNEPGLRNRLLDEEPRLVRYGNLETFTAALETLADGLLQIDGKLKAERKPRNNLYGQIGELTKLGRTLKAIKALKQAHNALLRLEDASSSRSAPIAGTLATAADPRLALLDAVSITARAHTELPQQLADNFQPAAARIAAAAATLSAIPDDVAINAALTSIHDILADWPDRLIDAILSQTEQMNFRSLVAVVRVNADRSLQFSLLQVSVIWRQVAFAIGIWRDISVGATELEELSADLERENFDNVNWSGLIVLGQHLRLVVPEDHSARARLDALLEAAYDRSNAVQSAITAPIPNPDALKLAAKLLGAAVRELNEEVRYQRSSADQQALAFAAQLSAISNVVAKLIVTVGMP